MQKVCYGDKFGLKIHQLLSSRHFKAQICVYVTCIDIHNPFFLLFVIAEFRHVDPNRKIDDNLCSTRQIGLIFDMEHTHQSYACNVMQQDHRMCVIPKISLKTSVF